MGTAPAPCLGLGGAGGCCCWKMPICQNANVWQEYFQFDKLLSKHSQGGWGRQGSTAQPPSSSSAQGDPSGAQGWGCLQRAGAAVPFSTASSPRCTVGTAMSQHLPLLRHSRRSSAFFFPTFKIGKKGLKRDLGARCWGQVPCGEEGKHQAP